jgi:hypothetical protein
MEDHARSRLEHPIGCTYVAQDGYIDQQAKKPFTSTQDDVVSFVSSVEIRCVHEQVWRDGSRLVPQPTTALNAEMPNMEKN